MLMRRFEFHMAPDAPPVGMTTGATIHTTSGLHMTITPRQVAAGNGSAAADKAAAAASSGRIAAAVEAPMAMAFSDGEQPLAGDGQA